MVSESVEEYLEAAYKLGGGETPVAISLLAKRLQVSPVSAHEMVKKLAKLGLVSYTPYKGVTLTEEGRSQALRVIRRHRLWERFLADVLGLPWDQVHEEACRLEHATSPLVEEKLAEFLAEPEFCPHGNPVPTEEGSVVIEEACALSELGPGQRGRVLRVSEEEPGLLQHLDALGLRPHAEVLVEEVAPFQGPLTVLVEGVRQTLGQWVASQIMVQRMPVHGNESS